MSDKQILLMPNEAPKFTGSWTIGEIRQMGEGLLSWLYSLPVTPGQPKEPDTASAKPEPD